MILELTSGTFVASKANILIYRILLFCTVKSTDLESMEIHTVLHVFSYRI